MPESNKENFLRVGICYIGTGWAKQGKWTVTDAVVTTKQWSQCPEAVGGSKVSNRALTLGFRRADFGSSRELVGEIS